MTGPSCSPRPMSRMERISLGLLITFLLSWVVPLVILTGPSIARTYVHMWKVVLGIEPDCRYPAAAFRWRDADCAATGNPAKTQDKLGEASPNAGGPRP